MSITRRELVKGAGALVVAEAAPALAQDERRSAVEPLLDETAEALLSEFPENATILGLDKGDRLTLKAKLTDRTPQGVERRRDAAQARLRRLGALEQARLSPADLIHVDTIRTAHQTALEGHRFGFGDVPILNYDLAYRPTPYTVTQNSGAMYETPDFLDSKHVIAGAADAEAYLARLEAFAAGLEGETERLQHQASIGVIAPSFLLDKTLKQHRSVRALAPDRTVMAASLARRSKAHSVRAEQIVARRIFPALDRQIAELERHRAQATDDAGVWKLPEGEAYYAWALRAGTTTERSPDEVHRQGLEELEALHARMDALLRAQDLTKGSVGERMTALGRNPRHLFPNTDAGRQQILDYCNGRIASIRTRLPRAFATMVPGRLVIKRVPVEIEAGAPGGYAGRGAIDGSTPGNYYLNLRDTSIWPRYGLPTLSYHEGIPGHIWQGEYAFKLPLARTLLSFNAYAEGWALYAEQLGDELGAYEEDPLGRLGYLQSLAFRACRLVVDTGLHAKRWTRAYAQQWFASTNGSTMEEVQGEVDRYCAWPGQACGYKVGHSEILRLRGKAQAALGPAFDLRTFNDALVLGGGVPMTTLGRVVDRHIASVQST